MKSRPEVYSRRRKQLFAISETDTQIALSSFVFIAQFNFCTPKWHTDDTYLKKIA